MDRPLRIGITCYPSVGGSGIIACALGDELAKRGHEVHFISYERPVRLRDGAERIFFHPVVINDYGLFKYPDYTLPLSVKMAEVSRAHDLDILHVHYAVPHATAAILAKEMLPAQFRPKVITTLHGTDTTLLGRDAGYAPAIRHALERSDGVTTVSDYLKAETRRLLGTERDIEVIHNFFEPRPHAHSREHMRALLGFRDDEAMILHHSNLRPVKRIDLLLKAVAQVRTRVPHKLVILAGADFSPFESLVKELGLSRRVMVCAEVTEVEDYLQAADLGLFTSESESFCLSLLEAMAFACPSVSTRVGGIPEVVEDGVHGVLVPFGDPAPLARAVETLLENPAKRAELGRAAQVRAREVFSADPVVEHYLAFYRRTLVS